MEKQLRVLRIVRIAMLLAAIAYVFLAESIRQNRQVEALSPTFYLAFAAVAASLAGATFLVRQNLIAKYAEVLRTQPDDAVALFRWFSGYFVLFAMAEAIVLFGFLLRVVGATAVQAAPFYAGGIILLLLFAPSRP